MKLGFVVGGTLLATAAILNVLPEYLYILLTGNLPSRAGAGGTAAPPATWSDIVPGGKAIEQALQGPLQSQNQQPGGGERDWSALPGAGLLDTVQKYIEQALRPPQELNQQQPQAVEAPATVEKPDWLRPVTGAE
jgi:hypothetical protein